MSRTTILLLSISGLRMSIMMIAVLIFVFGSGVRSFGMDQEKLDLMGSVKVLVQRDISPDGKSILFVKREFDISGNEIRVQAGGEYQGKPRNDTITTIPKYDGNHNKVAEHTYSANGTLMEKTLYAYNHKNEVVALVNYDEASYFANILPEGRLKNATLFGYDDDGLLIEKLDFSWLPNPRLKRTTYQYDMHGHKTRVIVQSNRGIKKRTFNYDENGRVRDILSYDNNSTDNKVVFEYDKYWNVTKETLLDQEGLVTSVVTYIYTYDSAGNWISKTSKASLRDGKPVSKIISKVTREIIYH